MPDATLAVLAPRGRDAHLQVVPAPCSSALARIFAGEIEPRISTVDPATAKTLVSAVLVASIAVFSLMSFQAFFAQIAADLRAVRVPVRTDRRDPPQD